MISFFNYPVCLPVLLVVEENPSCSYLAFDIFCYDRNYQRHIENRIQDHLSLILLRKTNFALFQDEKHHKTVRLVKIFVFEQALNAKYQQIISHRIHKSFLSMNRLSPNIQLPSLVSFDNYKTKNISIQKINLFKNCSLLKYFQED